MSASLFGRTLLGALLTCASALGACAGTESITQPSPEIGVSSTSVLFDATQGGPDAVAKSMAIHNAGGGTLNGLSVGSVTYGSGATGWLKPPQLSGTSAPSTLSLQPTTGTLAPGAYTATVQVVSTATDSPRDIVVVLTIAAPPQIGLSSTSLTFSGVQFGVNASAQQVSISNAGGGILSGLAVGSIVYGPGATGWLRPTTLSGSTAPATLTVQPFPTSTTPGTYTATIQILSATAANTPPSIAVSLTVLPPSPPLPSTTNVLVDLSHEFSFVYDIYGYNDLYWSPAFARTNNYANLATASVDLDRYDIVVINQDDAPVPFGEDEMQRLQNWVQVSGGRLVLTGRARPTLPLKQLAARFGIDFLNTNASLPYAVKQHPATVGVSAFATASGAASGTTLAGPSTCDPLIADAVERPVVLACTSGSGRVVAISEPAFLANPYVQPIINTQFAKQLMSWLGPRSRAAATVPPRLDPDLQMMLAGGTKLLYTARTSNSPFTSIAGAHHPQIDQELRQVTGLSNVFQMTFLALPCTGGGYSGGAEVGVCGYMGDGELTLVLAHELMHSFDNPNAGPEMMHPVVSYVATKVGAVLGGAAAVTAAQEKESWDAGFKAADPTGTKLDVTKDELFDRRGKMYWIIGRLEGTYPFATTNLYPFPVAARDPANFLKRYYQSKRSDVGYSPTPTNIVRLMSIAACRDLFPDFRGIGTTLGATPPGLSAEIATACPN